MPDTDVGIFGCPLSRHRTLTTGIYNKLDEEGLKEKKKQKLMKAGYEARIRAKRDKERDKEEKEAEEKKEKEERQRDLGEWAMKVRNEQETLMNRIKDRARRKAALSDRKSALAQARMKNIATLAADDRVPKKKRKAGGGECGSEITNISVD